MKKALLTLTILLTPTICSAGMGACHDGNGNITVVQIDATKQIFEQENCTYYEVHKDGVTPAIFDRIHTVLSTVQPRYIKWVNEPVEMTLQEKVAVDDAWAAQLAAQVRTDAKAQYDGQHASSLALRCMAKSILDEINIVRGWTVFFKAEAAAATNLANFQSRIATLDTLNNRTLSQAKTAIQNCIDAGQADE